MINFSTNSEISDGIPYFIVFLKFSSSFSVSSFSRAFSAFSESIGFGRFAGGISAKPDLALLISSGADAASCLARNVGGSVSNFVKMMNDKAKELNLNNTKFANPIGYDDINNYSTVKEISILFKYALNNETFKKIITTFSYKTHNNITLKHTLNYYANKYNLTLDNIS